MLHRAKGAQNEYQNGNTAVPELEESAQSNAHIAHAGVDIKHVGEGVQKGDLWIDVPVLTCSFQLEGLDCERIRTSAAFGEAEQWWRSVPVRCKSDVRIALDSLSITMEKTVERSKGFALELLLEE